MSRIIRDFAGVTSRSNKRAGFVSAHTAPCRSCSFASNDNSAFSFHNQSLFNLNKFSRLRCASDTGSHLSNKFQGFPLYQLTHAKSGFTLAEVLITLGIIGVVAAMTLPGLLVKTKEKEAVTRLKKVHVTLESAFRLAENEHSEVVNWFDIKDTKTNSEIFYRNLKPYLKVIKDCGFKEGCFHDGYVKTLDGRNYNKYNSNPQEYKIVLSDGTAIMFYLSNPDCTNEWNACGNIKVDFSTKNGDYTMGKDFFIFDITKKGIIPAGLQRDEDYPFENYCNISKNTDANGRSCAGWVIYNENMDYLHCNDLSWNGKSKCK